MSNFPIARKLDLSDIGDDWKGSYVVLGEPTVKTIKTIAKLSGDTDDMLSELEKLLQDSFVSGKAWNGKELVELKKEDLENMPMSVYERLIDFLSKGFGSVTKGPKK